MTDPGKIPSPDDPFPNEFGTTCFIKNVVRAPNVIIGDYTYYDDEDTVVGGNPARFLKKRFDDELTDLLLRLRWWDFPPEKLTAFLPVLCDPDPETVKAALKKAIAEKETT